MFNGGLGLWLINGMTILANINALLNSVLGGTPS